MNHQTTKSLLAGEIDKPKGNATVNDDTNFTMSCSGANPPLEQNETLVSAWCQDFLSQTRDIPATPDTGTASQITPGATSWQHSSLDGSDVENHEGEDHTFVIWFEINSDPMMPNDFRPFHRYSSHSVQL